jgi:hypothetical protein
MKHRPSEETLKRLDLPLLPDEDVRDLLLEAAADALAAAIDLITEATEAVVPATSENRSNRAVEAYIRVDAIEALSNRAIAHLRNWRD